MNGDNFSSNFSLESYQYEIPPELIANRPISPREKARLLVYQEDLNEIRQQTFEDLSSLLPSNGVLVLNQSKVFPCRLIGTKSSGGKCEVFIISLLPDDHHRYQCLIRTGGHKRPGDRYFLGGGIKAEIKKINSDGTFQISLGKTFQDDFSPTDLLEYLQRDGHTPIPPYIRMGDGDEQDRQDYQTVYAKDIGSVAAPTAGLHFGKKTIEDIVSSGIEIIRLTLHVNMGTFTPVKAVDIRQHSMHSEKYSIEREQLAKLNRAKAEGKRIFAVGTTSLRVLETIYHQGAFQIEPDTLHETNLFLYPGQKVESIDGLITNFHRPGSSLLMLVCALIGRQKTLDIYRQAIDKKYRFFSYGDAMLIERKKS